MKKRIMSLILCMALTLSMVPANTLAEEVDSLEEIVEAVSECEVEAEDEDDVKKTKEYTTNENIKEPDTEESIVDGKSQMTIDIDASELPDSDKLFREYAAEMFGIEEDVLSPNKSVEADYQLTTREREVFDYICQEVKKIADGDKTDTFIELNEYISELTWSYADMGVSEEEFAVENFERNGLNAYIWDTLYKSLDLQSIMRAVLFSCPYEMYWYAKSVNGAISTSLGYSCQRGADLESSSVSITALRMSLIVDTAYRASTEYTIDSEKTNTVTQAVQTAQRVVENAKGYSDIEKLNYYKQQICNLVSYNTLAASDSYNIDVQGMDPWQLVYVFDQNPQTNVVCEGYAKAFQYLCDRTSFVSRQVDCICVDGIMKVVDSGSGPHMWNVVRMNDGKNYLVDVTNCDDGAIGSPDQLFLIGAIGTVENGYQVAANGTEVDYIYTTETIGAYSKQRLELATEKYEPVISDDCEHNYDIGKVIKNANCTEDGERLFTCVNCSATYTETIVAQGHKWDWGTLTKEATDTEAGEITYTCEICKETKAIACTHSYTSSETLWDDCTKPGVKSLSCLTCGYSWTESAPARGEHNVSLLLVYEGRLEGPGGVCVTISNIYGCSICNYRYIETIEPDHDLGERTVFEFPTCTQNGRSGRVCQICGVIVDIEMIPTDLDSHIFETIDSKPWDCENDGYYEYRCTGCGYQKTQIMGASGHYYVDGLCVRCGNKYVCKEHSYNSGRVSKESTCKETGEMVYTCLNCGETYSEIIPLKSHSTAIDAAVEATCSTTGLTEGSHCSVCGIVLVAQETIAKKAHTWNAGAVVENPTCVKAGIRRYTCDVCGEPRDEAIEATGIHSYDNGVVTKEATCTAEGEKTYTCINEGCGTTNTQPIVAKGHMQVVDAAVPETCNKTGLTEGSHCSVCGTVLVAQEISAKKAHTWNAGEKVENPTCVKTGTKRYTCDVCGETQDEAIEATGIHSYDNGVVTKKAMCTEEGEKTYTCINAGCGATNIQQIPMKDHELDEGTYDSETITFRCKNCGEILSQKSIPVIDSLVNVSGGVTLSWNECTDANKYAVYYKVGGTGKWKKATTTKSTSYTKKSLKSGTTYYFQVKCLDKKGRVLEGYESAEESILYLGVPTLSSAVVAADGITVSWKSVTGATKYAVLQKNADGTWNEEPVAQTTGTSATVTELTNATRYDFTVACIDADGKLASGYNTKSKYATYVSPSHLLEPKNTAPKTMTIYWNKNDEVAGYQIQYSMDPNFKKGNKMLTITGNETTSKAVAKLSVGKTYYVRIRSLVQSGKTKYYSAWTTAENAHVTINQ